MSPRRWEAARSVSVFLLLTYLSFPAVHSNRMANPRPKRRTAKGLASVTDTMSESDPVFLGGTRQPGDRASMAGPSSTGARRTTYVLSDKWAHLGTLARSGLTQFFQRGIGSVEWLVFDIAERFRMGYVGTSVSNLAHLVGLRQPNHASLHWPYPPIRHGLPWPLENGMLGLRENLDLTGDISWIPPEEIKDALVDAYFTQVNPGFPVIDETKFRAQYSDKEKSPPLLLLQAVLLAGAHVCRHPQVAESRAVIKGILFRERRCCSISGMSPIACGSCRPPCSSPGIWRMRIP